MKHLLRIIIDTNVFVSGIFWSGHPYKILKRWQDRKIELIMSHEIMEEYTRVFEILSAKYPPINLTDFVELILSEAKFFKAIKLPQQVCADADDDKFIACALASKADCIISGDKELLAVSGYQNIKIIKPIEFVKNHL